MLLCCCICFPASAATPIILKRDKGNKWGRYGQDIELARCSIATNTQFICTEETGHLPGRPGALCIAKPHKTLTKGERARFPHLLKPPVQGAEREEGFLLEGCLCRTQISPPRKVRRGQNKPWTRPSDRCWDRMPDIKTVDTKQKERGERQTTTEIKDSPRLRIGGDSEDFPFLLRRLRQLLAT